MDYKTAYRKYKIANVLGDKFEDEEFVKMYNFFKNHLCLDNYLQCSDPDDPTPGDYVFIKNDDIWLELDNSLNIVWVNPRLVLCYRENINDLTSSDVYNIGKIFNTHYNKNFKFITRLGSYKIDYISSMFVIKEENRTIYKYI